MGRRHAAASGLVSIQGRMLGHCAGRASDPGILWTVRASWPRPIAPGDLMQQPKRKTMPRKGAGGRATHDVGGLEFGAIDRSEHDLALWEKRTDAMLILLVGPKKGAFAIDAHRRVIEDYGQQTY